MINDNDEPENKIQIEVTEAKEDLTKSKSRAKSRAKSRPTSRAKSRTTSSAAGNGIPVITTYKQPKGSNLQTSLSASLSNSVSQACKKGDLEALKACVQDVSSREAVDMLNWTDRNASTPLYHCAWRGDVECIEWMVHHGADIHWANFRDNYPMDMAIETFSTEAVAKFIELGAEITMEHWEDVQERMLRRLRNMTPAPTKKELKKKVAEMAKILDLGMVKQRRPPKHTDQMKGWAGHCGFVKKNAEAQAATDPDVNSKYLKQNVNKKDLTGRRNSHDVLSLGANEDGMADQSIYGEDDPRYHNPRFLPDAYKHKLHWIFDDVDTSEPKFLITKAEVIAMNARLEVNTRASQWESDAVEFMDYVDEDGSGEVSLLEWFNAWEKLVVKDGLAALDEFIDEYAATVGFKGQVI